MGVRRVGGALLGGAGQVPFVPIIGVTYTPGFHSCLAPPQLEVAEGTQQLVPLPSTHRHCLLLTATALA
jgi:hypothetical protein